MNRRTFLGAPAVMNLAAQAPSRPNVLFLMADQHRGDCVGADGNAQIHTPHLDRIAREGARFPAAYSTTPTCTPARACLLTGLAPWNHGMLAYGRVANKYAYEMPTAMKSAGYYTFAIGKCHYSPQRNLHGFDGALLDESGRSESIDFRSDYRSWFYSEAPNLNPDATGVGFNDYNGKPYVLPEHLHPTAWTGQSAVNFLKTYERGNPFFLKVSFARPHSPYDPPQRWWDFYGARELPKAQAGRWADRYEKRSWEKNDIWHGRMPESEIRASRQGYFGSISFIDEQIGRILEVLETRGMLENTLILYTSDHGDMTGDQHLWRKSYAYEASARVPMLMRWPRGLVSAARGQTIDAPVELRDIFPTCLDAAGAALRQPVDGRTMLALARGNREGWREFSDLEHGVCYDKSNQWTALTDGKTKYIFHAFSGEEQLFDLTKDRAELHDLAGSAAHTDALRTWRQRMIAHLAPRGEKWVAGGALARREAMIQYSPNYPRAAAAGA
jgi:arylsulfatase